MICSSSLYFLAIFAILPFFLAFWQFFSSVSGINYPKIKKLIVAVRTFPKKTVRCCCIGKLLAPGDIYVSASSPSLKLPPAFIELRFSRWQRRCHVSGCVITWANNRYLTWKLVKICFKPELQLTLQSHCCSHTSTKKKLVLAVTLVFWKNKHPLAVLLPK